MVHGLRQPDLAFSRVCGRICLGALVALVADGEEWEMPRLRDLTVQYVTTDKGDKTAVIVPIKEFEELMENLEELVEDLEDLAMVAERRGEPAIAHDQLLAELTRDVYRG